jgi:MFS family permease
VIRWVKSELAELRGYHAQFWLNFGAMFLYLASSSFVFPYLGLYMRDTLGISLTLVGVVQGVSSFAGMPFQVLGGFWADRRGRRGVLLLSLLASAVLFAALAFVHAFWLVVTLVIAQGALGWPMFLTASNAIVADLVPPHRMAEAYGLMRVAMNAGVIAGPAIAGLALAGGARFRELFITAAVGCAALYLLVLMRLRETRPAGTLRAATAGGGALATPPGGDQTALGAAVDPFVMESPGGYRSVLHDRRFLALCAVSLLPLFCYGHIVTTLPVYLSSFHRVPASTFGLLISFNGLLILVVQYPLIRGLQTRDHLLLAGVASALLGVGIGGAVAGGQIWWLIVIMVLFTIGEMIFVPISSSIVAALAPEAARGRYMGVWSLVWVGGQAVAPTTMGWAMSGLGRASYLIVIAAGFAGAALFVVLRRASGRLSPV